MVKNNPNRGRTMYLVLSPNARDVKMREPRVFLDRSKALKRCAFLTKTGSQAIFQKLKVKPEDITIWNFSALRANNGERATI